jgi:hypothetical protein
VPPDPALFFSCTKLVQWVSSVALRRQPSPRIKQVYNWGLARLYHLPRDPKPREVRGLISVPGNKRGTISIRHV